MNKVFLLLGSNMGDSQALFSEAIAVLQSKIGTVVEQSALYKSPPWGFKHENDFLNQALGIETNLAPQEVLKACLSIELYLGRSRDDLNTYQARTIDIDILLFNTDVITQKDLKIPHIHLHNRRFALLPLCEIASDVIHPNFENTIEQLLYSCKDDSKVIKV
jgi:2-amino-4-hydroxy-6-hydroxymethyldihydropteridine diphosphokinase